MKKKDLGKDKKTTELFLKDWLARSIELVDLFEPKLVYFDFWIENEEFKPYLLKFLAYYYSKTYEKYGHFGIVNYKHDAIPYTLAVRDIERGQMPNLSYEYWQGCNSLAHNSWIYTEDNIYKDDITLIRVLIDVVSKNGNLLLNFGAHPDGYIVEKEKKILESIGSFLDINGEGIFETKPYKIFGEGKYNVTGGDFSNEELPYQSSDYRFTCKQNYIYAFNLNPKDEEVFRIYSFGRKSHVLKKNIKIIKVEILGYGEVEYIRKDDCLEFIYSASNSLPICLKLTLD